MEAYSPELTSPPVPLVALCGKQELLRPIADYLRTQHVPRVHSIGVEDAHSAAGAFGEADALQCSGGSLAPPPSHAESTMGRSACTTPLQGSGKRQAARSLSLPAS